MKTDRLVKAAVELNKLLGLEPAIDTDRDEAYLRAQLLEVNNKLLTPDDVLSAETSVTLKLLKGKKKTPTKKKGKKEKAVKIEKKKVVEKKQGKTKKKINTKTKPIKAKEKVKKRENSDKIKLFIQELRKGPKTMAQIKKAKWNTTRATFYYPLKKMIISGEIKKNGSLMELV